VGHSPAVNVKALALNLLAANESVPACISAGTTSEPRPERTQPTAADKSQILTAELAPSCSPDRLEREDLLEEAQRVRQTAWGILRQMVADGDYRGALAALRECKDMLETLGPLLMEATDPNFAGISDEDILEEAKRRDLKMPLNVQVAYDQYEARKPGSDIS
jgi:hypothetical protein